MKMTLRLCTKCGISKIEEDYYEYSSKLGRMRQCKVCTTASSAARYAKNSEKGRQAMRDYYKANRAKIQTDRKEKRNSVLEVKLKHMLRNASQRATLKGFDFNIDYEYLSTLYEAQQGLCYYTDRELTLTGAGRVSIDRKDPSKGYTKDNINLVCLDVNYMKRDISHEDFVRFAKLVGGKF
jgi:hypothetical protein